MLQRAYELAKPLLATAAIFSIIVLLNRWLALPMRGVIGDVNCDASAWSTWWVVISIHLFGTFICTASRLSSGMFSECIPRRWAVEMIVLRMI